MNLETRTVRNNLHLKAAAMVVKGAIFHFHANKLVYLAFPKNERGKVSTFIDSAWT
jgi:hypothetical protein